MNGNRVHLLDLKMRTSAAGNSYLSGWLGKAAVVGFLDREADGEVWQIFVSTPAARNNATAATGQPSDTGRRRRRNAPSPLPPGTLDDSLSDL